MDYHNADGSPAEMCGNGIRVFAEFLIANGLLALAEGDTVPIGTRGGVRSLTRVAGGYEVDLGAFVVAPGEAMVSARRLDVARPGLAVGVGNPHVVVALADEQELDALDLRREFVEMHLEREAGGHDALRGAIVDLRPGECAPDGDLNRLPDERLKRWAASDPLGLYRHFDQQRQCFIEAHGALRTDGNVID